MGFEVVGECRGTWDGGWMRDWGWRMDGAERVRKYAKKWSKK